MRNLNSILFEGVFIDDPVASTLDNLDQCRFSVATGDSAKAMIADLGDGDNDMNDLLKSVKLSGQDFEWYPTTRKMLEVVAKDIHRELDEYGQENMTYSVLDIGAGNGSALKILHELTSNDGDAYAIEKSKLLIDALPADVFVIGTDFHEQTLIDKCVEVVFCNPPYSEYETWMQRIVAEADCRLLYMVVPERWKSNKVIAAMIGRRCGAVKLDGLDLDEDTLRTCHRANGKIEVLASMSFEDSEFRQARAQIDIVKIRFQDKGYHGRRELETDPFDIWFENTFAIAADKGKGIEDSKSSAEALHELVQGQNLIERLEELYRDDFGELLETYRALEKLDPKLFKELGVDLAQVKGGLKAKVAGLKNLYWQELFGNLETITLRLTSASREKLLRKLTEHTSIDFTAINAYAVVVWAIKNANAYFDNQLLELYLALADRENIRNYKSNKKLIEDGWRYQRKEYSHYTLDYRLVLERHSCFSEASYDRYDFPNGLSRPVHALLNDICTIAENLGFDVTTNSFDIKWTPGSREEFYLADGRLFMDVRAYKKGTVHIRVDQDFMRKLNVEAARLNGWVKSPAEAAQETGINNAAEIFGTNFKLKSIPLLTAPGPEKISA